MEHVDRVVVPIVRLRVIDIFTGYVVTATVLIPGVVLVTADGIVVIEAVRRMNDDAQASGGVTTRDERGGVIRIGLRRGVRMTMPSMGLLVGDMNRRQIAHDTRIDGKCEMNDTIGMEDRLQMSGVVTGLGQRLSIPDIWRSFAHLVRLIHFESRIDRQAHLYDGVATVALRSKALVVDTGRIKHTAIEVVVIRIGLGSHDRRMQRIFHVHRHAIDGVATADNRTERVVIDTGRRDLLAMPVERVTLTERVAIGIEEFRMLIDSDLIYTVATEGRSDRIVILAAVVIERTKEGDIIAVTESECGILLIDFLHIEHEHIGTVTTVA